MHHPLNLRVLQRHDPTITDIVDSTSYAVLYDFHDDRWHKTGKEGTLFIYERSEPPTHGIFLLNRSSPENFSHPILASTAFDMQGKVLMLEDAGANDDDDSIAVSGLWVSNGEEGQTLLDRLTEIRDSLKSSSAPPPSSDAGPPSALSSLLSGLAASSLAAPHSSPSLATSPSVSSTLASVPVPSSSASTSATTPSVATATTTTTTTTTNGSLSFSEILNRLQSPALPKATPALSGQQQSHPSPSDAASAVGHPAHLLQNQPHPPFPSSPLRQPPLPSHGHGSPAHYPPPPPPASSSSHFGSGPSSHPPPGPASHFYPYPPHQLHHQQQGPHQPPVHTFAHQHASGSPTASPFQAHAAPAPMPPYGFPPPHANQPFPPSPFAQHAPVPGLPNGLLHHNGAGPPPPPPPSFLGLPHPMQPQQHPPSPMHSPARTPASGARPSPAYAAQPSSLSSASGGPLPRGTQLLDAMFSSMGPPVPASNGH